MLKKLANGEYSLKIMFWIFGVLGIFIFNIITNITHNSVLHQACLHKSYCPKSVLLYAIGNILSIFLGSSRLMLAVGAHIILSTIFGIYIYLLLHGLWVGGKSSEGSAFWSACAKIILICLAVVSLKSII